MKNTYKRRLSILTTSIGTALLLSSCQPANDDANNGVDSAATEVAKEAATTDADTSADPHAAHNMHDMNSMPANDAPMSAMLKDYTDSMTTMHDEMMAGLVYNDPDVAFAQGMLGHHKGAVAMAEIELKYGKDPEMRKLAQTIIDEQQAEIEQMNAWLAKNPDAPAPTADTKAMQQAYADGMDAMHQDMMAGITDPIPDKAFARGMLPHHIGAVDMAKVHLEYGNDPEMRKLAQAIIDAQQAEIEQMQRWLSANKR